MTKKKPGAKIGRPKKEKRNEERLALMAEVLARPDVNSYSTAAELVPGVEAEKKKKPTDPAQLRRLWKQEEDAEKAKGAVGPNGEWLYSHPRAEKALYEKLKKQGLTPVLVGGKLVWRPKPK